MPVCVGNECSTINRCTCWYTSRFESSPVRGDSQCVGVLLSYPTVGARDWCARHYGLHGDQKQLYRHGGFAMTDCESRQNKVNEWYISGACQLLVGIACSISAGLCRSIRPVLNSRLVCSKQGKVFTKNLFSNYNTDQKCCFSQYFWLGLSIKIQNPFELRS